LIILLTPRAWSRAVFEIGTVRAITEEIMTRRTQISVSGQHNAGHLLNELRTIYQYLPASMRSAVKGAIAELSLMADEDVHDATPAAPHDIEHYRSLSSKDDE
jgi:hypothetical protein